MREAFFISRSFRYTSLAAASLATAAASGLKWEQTAIERQAQSGDKKIEAVYTFTNTSAQPIGIESIKTSCGCLATDFLRKNYQPGERGELKIVFTSAGRKGLQEKSVVVRTSENQEDILLLKVLIPEMIHINKEMLSWRIGDPLESQSFEITATGAEPAKVTAIRSLNPNFETKLEEIKVGKSYRVTVKPLSTERSSQAILRMDVEDPSSRSLFLRVLVDG